MLEWLVIESALPHLDKKLFNNSLTVAPDWLCLLRDASGGVITKITEYGEYLVLIPIRGLGD